MEEKEEHKAIGTSSAMFNDIVEEENMKDNIMDCFCKFICSELKNFCENLKKNLLKNNGEEDLPSEEDRVNLEIQSNPLFLSLKWLWRNNPQSPQHKESKKGKESKLKDVIEAALDDAFLLEKMASYENPFSHDKYMDRAEECEKFAIDIVEQVNGNKELLHKVMDIDGEGALVNKKSDNFICSLSLLKMAANKERKMFVASPNCQFVLDEVIYYGIPGWRNMGIGIKTFWCLLQLLQVSVMIPFYIPLKLIRKNFPCCRGCDSNCLRELYHWLIMLYEHPYSKFLNHTLSYIIFLALIFGSSFEHKYGPGGAGLTWIDLVIMHFVLGLLIQEIVEAWRQGAFIYFSKWWNVVDTVIILAFIGAYGLWLIAWGVYGEWKPEKKVFIYADGIYASACVVAYFHLAHFFQVNSTLGPLQLSLYKMLRDVLKFLAIFLLLYFAFATGVAKIYSYYVASQIELQKRDTTTTDHQVSHPLALHANTFIVLFWLLFGGGGQEESISVQDQDFMLITKFGRVFMGAYVICTILVALNMLIAMMNDSFHKIKKNAVVEWKFSRTQMWLEWIDKGNSVPVPFNIPYVVLYLFFPFRCLFRKSLCFKGEQNNEVSIEDIPGSNFERCDDSKDSETFDKKSMKQDRPDAVKTLVVEYLKKHYEAKWNECRAKTARSDSERDLPSVCSG
ncbi:unnamed protein product [Pocillopora meandrina]|uniref:Ion transport domain-containing protein n=1 Tax=Pocillopora meandrina TaxID=46732 RepID=A0AAU9WG13_9CNID|nr:unnamed protein product [Pocillopora meandrina]